VFVLLLVVALSPALFAAGVAREACFPVEDLPERLRPKAQEIILKMMDSESLFTIVGRIKPIGAGFWRTRFEVEEPALEDVADVREVLTTVRCGDEFFAGLVCHSRTHSGKRYVSAFVAHRPTLRRMLRERSAFWAPFGLTPNSHPLEVMLKTEHMSNYDRCRGFGYIYGYPKYAVDFFVAAARHRVETGESVKRTFVQIPTFARKTGGFVYAAPEDHVENEADRELKLRAEAVLNTYRSLRERYIGEGKPGVVALLRDWFDDGAGLCSSANARTDGRLSITGLAGLQPSQRPIVVTIGTCAWNAPQPEPSCRMTRPIGKRLFMIQ